MRPINASLSPNTEPDDVAQAFRMLCTPWRWKGGDAVKKAEDWFLARFPQAGCAVSFNSGRSALYCLLAAFGIGSGDEVLVQAFTCVAVSNSVLWTGAKAIFVDIDKTLNIDPDELPKKATGKTKAIIVQHTLGTPADMDRILTFAKKHGLLVIEDCAHSLGAQYNGKPVGGLSDASFFSFGRDKVISSVFGGMALVSRKHPHVAASLCKMQQELQWPTMFWIFQQLLHPVIFFFVLPLYTQGIGKALLFAAQRLRLLSFPVYPEEKLGKRPGDFPARYPNALATLILRQLDKLERYNAKRRDTADMYAAALKNNTVCTPVKTVSGGIYLRFAVLCKDRNARMRTAKSRGILLGNWYHNTVDPTGVDMHAIGYTKGSCPAAESAASTILNLPTLVTKEQTERVIKLL